MVIDCSILTHLILVSIGAANFIYIKVEKVFIIIGMLIFISSALLCFPGRFRKPYHKHVLLWGMILGGGVIYAILGEDGGPLLMFPMFAAGMYYSEDMCKKTFVHLVIINIIDNIAFFWLDINIIHYYNLSWDLSLIIINFIIPGIVYISVVFLFSLYTMRSGRKLLAELVSVTEDSVKRDAEIETCAEVQRSTLPDCTDLAPGGEFSISAGIQPAYETAGDFYDMFITDSGKLMMLIADVSDKGLGSALYMMSTRNTIRSLSDFLDEPGEILSRANDILCSTSDKEFVTVFLAAIDIKTGCGKYVNAGHNPPVLMRRDGSASLLDTAPQLIMGAFSGVSYRTDDISLKSGDVLCMYTDGIPESVNTAMEEYGTGRIISLLQNMVSRPPDEICNALLADVDSYSDDSKFIDDRTVEILKWN